MNIRIPGNRYSDSFSLSEKHGTDQDVKEVNLVINKEIKKKKILFMVYIFTFMQKRDILSYLLFKPKTAFPVLG